MLLSVSKVLFKSVHLHAAQVELHITMLSLVLVLDPSTWMMLLVPQVIANYWSALAAQSCNMTVITMLMLVWGVKVTIF